MLSSTSAALSLPLRLGTFDLRRECKLAPRILILTQCRLPIDGLTCAPQLPANAGERVVKTKLIIPAAVALVLTCLHHSVALAWGPGGGVPGIPGFSALWDEPKPKAIGQETKKCWSSDPAGRRSGKVKKKAWRGLSPAPGPFSR